MKYKKMTKNNALVAWGLIISYSVSFLDGLLDLELSEGTLILDGLAMGVFAVWAAIILFKTADQK